MKKANSVYLQDIANALDQIDKYTKNVTFNQFVEEDMRHDAVIRQMEIIGEAARQVSPPFRQAHPEIPWQGIISQSYLATSGSRSGWASVFTDRSTSSAGQ